MRISISARPRSASPCSSIRTRGAEFTQLSLAYVTNVEVVKSRDELPSPKAALSYSVPQPGEHSRRTEMRSEIDKFRCEKTAYEFVEAEIWPQGPICPHCRSGRRIKQLAGESTRLHTYKCYGCCKPFTVKIGTIFEASKVPMHKWLQLIVLYRATRQELPAYRASRVLGVTPKTADMMLRRLQRGRYATRRRSRPL